MSFKKTLSAFVSAALMSACLICGLAGCSGQGDQASEQGGTGAETNAVRIGTMPTEDILPMWVAEQDGLFADAGLDAEIVVFDSAPALSAAITAGEVDVAMVDIMRAVKLCESGAPVVLEWVTLGTDASQGRFGVLAPGDAPYSTLQELAEQAKEPDSLAAKGVGVAANTVPEYVLDMLCEQEGIDATSIPTQEVASLPERYSLMASGNLAAAALPGSLLELGEANGMKLLADDTNVADGANISQSVMVAAEAFAQNNPETIKKLAEVWDAAAQAINGDPSAYISLLAEKANLNETIADTYPISTYPMALLSDGELAHPASTYVDQQIEWMKAKGYSTQDVSYDESTGVLTVGA